MKQFDRAFEVVGYTTLGNNLISLDDYIYFEFPLKEQIDELTHKILNKLFLMSVTREVRISFFWEDFLFDEVKKGKTDSVFWLISKLISQTNSYIEKYNSLYLYGRKLEYNRVSSPRISSDGKKLIIGINFNGYSLDDIKNNKYIESILDFIEESIERVDSLKGFSTDVAKSKSSAVAGFAIDEVKTLL